MTVNCKTPGLRIDWKVSTYGNNLYATLVHETTGLYIRNFTSTIIEGGKRRFAAKVDECVGHINWLKTPEELSADANAVKDAVYRIPYNCR